VLAACFEIIKTFTKKAFFAKLKAKKSKKTKNTAAVGATVFFLGLGGEQRVLEYKVI